MSRSSSVCGAGESFRKQTGSSAHIRSEKPWECAKRSPGVRHGRDTSIFRSSGGSAGCGAADSHTASSSSTEFWLLFPRIQLAWGSEGKKKPEAVAQLIRGFQAEAALPDLQWIRGLSVETVSKGKSEQASYS